jgi:omega-6 fatty acid desaturase (delta-12 desaturase)
MRMHKQTPTARTAADSRALANLLGRYRTPDAVRSVFELVISGLPFVLLWALIWTLLNAGYWLGLFLAIPAAGFLVRLFMIQHDCGHGAFFRQRRANDWVGRVISVLTLTPYDHWRRDHAAHHAGSGNLDRRGIGDINTLTVREYLALPRWRQLLYRLYRHPFVMFGIGPAYLFLLQNRLPSGLRRGGWKSWLSAMATNGAIAVLVAAMIWLVGLGPFLLVHLPIMLLAASIGVWLFYIQHQFEDTYWAHDARWNFHAAAADQLFYKLIAQQPRSRLCTLQLVVNRRRMPRAQSEKVGTGFRAHARRSKQIDAHPGSTQDGLKVNRKSIGRDDQILIIRRSRIIREYLTEMIAILVTQIAVFHSVVKCTAR